MQRIEVPGTGLRCSRFVFGTASLFNAGDRAQRRRVLDAAVDHGFTHFDTAPLYGFGAAERDLAPVLRVYPGLTVTTKVGLYPPGGADQSERLVFARKAAGRLLPALSRPRADGGVAAAQRSLEASLRRLGRERVELLLLHEPELARIDAAALADWLEGRVRAGQVGAYGIALDAARLAPFLAAESPLAAVVQTEDSLDVREADALAARGRPLQFTYGYVSAARRRGQTDARAVLAAALARNASGAILVTTNRPERMAQYAAAAEAAR